MISSLIINTANHIYLCTYEDESQIIGRLYAFDADGTIRWVYKCSSIFWCDPVISREGIIYVGQNVNSKLYAFSPDGELLWEKRMGQGEGHRPPVIDQDGVMYWCLSSQLYAIAPDGEVKWIYQPEESYVDTSPSLGADGNLYVNLTGGEFICLTRDGEQLWKAETKGFAITQPILGRCGNVIQSRLMDNSIESYSVVDIFSQKGVHLAETAIKGSIHSVILANDEVIYVLSSYWTAKMEPKWELVRLQPEKF
ncbi:PQQ-binding-like beta-propeller repeat protein [Paenibacillus sp. FSL H7-0716]|nr:PQQ-binding-like beta-propeller repeat protein [Paenibacillus odorifer]